MRASSSDSQRNLEQEKQRTFVDIESQFRSNTFQIPSTSSADVTRRKIESRLARCDVCDQKKNLAFLLWNLSLNKSILQLQLQSAVWKWKKLIHSDPQFTIHSFTRTNLTCPTFSRSEHHLPDPALYFLNDSLFLLPSRQQPSLDYSFK